MHIALLSPIAWRTPPRHYGPWEQVVSLLAEGLVRNGIDVTLFATADSQTAGKLCAVCPRPYEEDRSLDPKVWECLHVANLFEKASDFDLIHNHFDFLPLSYSRLVDTPLLTTIHGFSSPKILPVYKRYLDRSYYVSISDADRNPEIDYIATVYHGIDLDSFAFHEERGDYLLFFGRIHHDKGAHEAIQVAKAFGMKLIMAGVIQDQKYYDEKVAPYLDGDSIAYVGSVGPSDRDKLLGGAYALLHPINFNEPFGLSVVEAMACGTPVVAVPRGSMREIILDGETGFFALTVEEFVERLKDVPQLDRLKCRSYVQERFSRERMVKDYLGIYRRILEKKATSPQREHIP
ncbi:MAG: glycosyltransferase family 4 protein [bacterium]